MYMQNLCTKNVLGKVRKMKKKKKRIEKKFV